MFIFEYNNPNTLKYMSFGEKLTNAFFASATTRTLDLTLFLLRI